MQALEVRPEILSAHRTQRASPQPWDHTFCTKGVAAWQEQGTLRASVADGALVSSRFFCASPPSHYNLNLTLGETTSNTFLSTGIL
mmetsp:Transcript_17305/g.31482  ORF Transcript_17305/g.31482 Transcript_17305/m.31482 type:complete len:86 (-) Transcript_17305:1176-1433(-)